MQQAEADFKCDASGTLKNERPGLSKSNAAGAGMVVVGERHFAEESEDKRNLLISARY